MSLSHRTLLGLLCLLCCFTCVASFPIERKKVYALFYQSFPISVNNEPPDQDTYTRDWNNVTWSLTMPGYNNCNAFFVDRPIPRQPFDPSVNWSFVDAQTHVRNAIAAGLDGFVIPMFAFASNPTHADTVVRERDWETMLMVMDAAVSLSATFKCWLMTEVQLDNTTDVEGTWSNMSSVAGHPAMYHFPDGSIPWGSFDTSASTVPFLQQFNAGLAAASPPGVVWRHVAMYLNNGDLSTTTDWLPVVDGLSTWASHVPVPYCNNSQWETHNVYNKSLWVMPVGPQNLKDKYCRVYESNNTLAMRAWWESAISSDSDWAFTISWGDYSEHHHIQPSVRIGYVFTNLTRYYSDWFKTGRPPTPLNDSLIYTHRLQAHDAPPNMTLQVNGPFVWSLYWAFPPVDMIEVVAILYAPAVVQVELNGQRFAWNACTGMNVFTLPLQEGIPIYTLVRGGDIVLQASDIWPISNSILYQNLLYHGDVLVAAPTGTLSPAFWSSDPSVVYCNETVALHTSTAAPSTTASTGTTTGASGSKRLLPVWAIVVIAVGGSALLLAAAAAAAVVFFAFLKRKRTPTRPSDSYFVVTLGNE